MIKRFKRFSVNLKLFLLIVFGIIISVIVITVFSIQKSKNEIRLSLQNNLTLEVKTIIKMFEREHSLKLDKVKTDLKIANNLFYSEKLKASGLKRNLTITNQITKQKCEALINEWCLGDKIILGDTSFVDKTHELFGGTTTIFQRTDSGYVRISTNVLKSDGTRAVGTYIPNSSEVVKTINKNKTYFGRAFVVNDWYITAYEPIVWNNSVIGMLYVGDKEKDLNELQRILSDLKIGKSGFIFAFDDLRKRIVSPKLFEQKNLNKNLIDYIINHKRGIQELAILENGEKYLVAFEYFPDFKLFVAAAVDQKYETKKLFSGVVINSIIIGIIIIIVFSIFVYIITTGNLRKFFKQLEKSETQLSTTRLALEKSERQFKTLFNNSGDEIFVVDFDGNFVEVNDFACQTLGYSHEEFIKMNFRDIKSENFIGEIKKNIELIRKFGQYRYESEHATRDGKVIPVEMKSRVIEYNDETVFLSIARDITERKEIEEKILTAIIKTEEKERKRFAADLHDDLAPILSTVKLYTDLIKKGNYKNINESETIKNIDELVDMAISTTKEISNNIRPNILQDFGLAAAINEFCSFINNTKSINIRVKTQKYKINKRGIEETILYQTVKELINNTLKHSQAKNVVIELKSYKNQIILYYRDDGIGFNIDEAVKNKSGLGLYNIFNKIKTINGSCDLNSEINKGMFLLISIKLKV